MAKTPMDTMLDSIKWEILPPLAPEENQEGIPYATHKGVLWIGDCPLDCYVLNTGQRIFTVESVERLFGGGK